MSDERRCARCGKPVPVGTRTCPSCGRLLVDRQADRLGGRSTDSLPVAKMGDTSGAAAPQDAPSEPKTDSFYAVAPRAPPLPPGAGKNRCPCACLLVPLFWIAILLCAL